MYAVSKAAAWFIAMAALATRKATRPRSGWDYEIFAAEPLKNHPAQSFPLRLESSRCTFNDGTDKLTMTFKLTRGWLHGVVRHRVLELCFQALYPRLIPPAYAFILKNIFMLSNILNKPVN